MDKEQKDTELLNEDTQSGSENSAIFHVNVPDEVEQDVALDEMEIPNPSNASPHAPNGSANNSPDDFKTFKSAQNLALAGSICGAISVVIGGVILGGIGLALAIASLKKYKKVTPSAFDASLLAKLKRSSTVAIVICAGAVVVNLVSALLLFPTIMSYLESSDASSLYSSLDSSQSISSSRSQTWG